MEFVDPLLYGLFLLATTVLVLTPGPVVSLAVAETLLKGTRCGLAVVFGASTVAIIYLGLNYGGFYLIGSLPKEALIMVRYAGAAYLVYLAYRSFRQSTHRLTSDTDQQLCIGSPCISYKRALLIAASNPKVILFFAAFFPQFISTNYPVREQLLILSISFLVVTLILDSGWVFVAGMARTFLQQRGRINMVNHISAAMLAAGAIGLLFLNA